MWSYNYASGTITNLATGFGGTDDDGLALAGGIDYIAGCVPNTAAPTELWASDGTSAGTHLVTTLPDETPSGQLDTAGIYDLTALASGKLVFSDFNGVSYDAYVSDGTANGTVPMFGYNGGRPYFGAGRSVEINGNLLFTDATNGLWSYNETTGVATQLATLALGSNGGEMTLADGLAYFAARA